MHLLCLHTAGAGAASKGVGIWVSLLPVPSSMLVWTVWRRPRREWNPSTVKLQLEAHKVRQGHRRSCGSCGSCGGRQKNIMLALARFSATSLTYYSIPRLHQNWSQKVSNSKFPGVEYAPRPSLLAVTLCAFFIYWKLLPTGQWELQHHLQIVSAPVPYHCMSQITIQTHFSIST